MDKQHITQCHVMTPWYAWGTFFLLWFVYSILSAYFGIPTDTFWGCCLGMLVCGVIVFLVHHFLLDGDIVLSDRGVEVRGRIGRTCAWKNCTQVIAMQFDRERILVLLKSGGWSMKEGKTNFGFFLRNPGRVIFLPDDKFTRAFVEKYYGPLDFDLSDGRPEKSIVED